MTERRLPKTAVENLVEDLASKANVDLSNLDAAGQAKFDAKADIALTNSPYTTNRILEIPQDIKLELNNGTLTLKAGSKIYIPNGFEADGTTPKFDVVTIDTDIPQGSGHNAQDMYVYQNYSSSRYVVGIPKEWFFSGNSAPSDNTYMYWYDTTSNLIKWTSDNGTTWSSREYSFPICIATGTSATYPYGMTSIDQVFNGFGYIGSTVFVLPGVKVQIPNGKNEDGTYKVIPYTTQNVITREVTGIGVKDITLQPNGILNWATGGLYFAEDGYHHGYTVSSINISAVLARVLITTAGKIDSFVPRNVDSVVNSNASNFSQAGRSYLSGLGMPSNRYIDLTLGASGTQYTAPANGWFSLDTWTTSTATAYYQLNNRTSGLALLAVPDQGHGYQQKGFIPCKAGDIVAFVYANIDTTKTKWRFIYAQGEQ